MDSRQTIFHFLIECDYDYVAELRRKLYDYIWTLYDVHFAESLDPLMVQENLNKLDWNATDVFLYCNIPGKEDWNFQIKRQTIAFLSAIKRILITWR